MDVIAIGSANVDLVANVSRFPVKDDEVAIRGLKMVPGGSAANVSVGASRLGLESGFVGLIGTDSFGQMLNEEFEKEGVDISGVIQKPGMSGLVFAAINKEGERAMFSSEGVGASLSLEHVPFDYLKKARFIHLSNIDADGALESYVKIAGFAKDNGIKVFFDPGCIFAELGIDKLRPLLENCYLVKPNRLESRMMTGTNGEKAARIILKAGAENVVITEGLDGCVVGSGGAVKRIPFVPIRKYHTIDLTGAGDSFASGMLAALSEGRSIDDAVGFAMQIGAMSTETRGGRGTPRKAELPPGLLI